MSGEAPRPDPGDRVPLADKLAFLAEPAQWAELRPQTVELRETHMSWLFLTERHAHKLKKPTRLPHLDFTALAARHRACRAELRLNRRLAPDVYEGLNTLCVGADGRLCWGPGEAVVEWLVRMGRLPERRMLSFALSTGAPDAGDLERVARRLAEFYGGLPAVQVPFAMRRSWLDAEIARSFETLVRPEFALDRTLTERVAARLVEVMLTTSEMFVARHQAGRIVEGHGDLRPEHVCLGNPPVIIDCLEFSRRLRIVDPVDELAFLALECAMAGAPEVGLRLQRGYETYARDRPPERLIAFHTGYRALLRARLSALHSLEPGSRPPAAWLAKAAAYLDVAAAASDELI